MNLTWDRNDTCVDINEYLRVVQHDLTTYQSTKIVFSIVYALIITLAVIGNVCVVFAVIRNRALHSVRNMFIVSLSLSDICVSTISGYVTPTSVFSKEWHFGGILCTVLPILQGMSLSVSTFTMTMISIDRYILIVHPTRRPISLRQAIVIILCIWLLAMLLCVPLAVYQVLIEQRAFITDAPTYYCGVFCIENFNPSVKTYYSTLVQVMQFILPLIVISIGYSSIFRKLASHGRLRAPSVGTVQNRAMSSGSMKMINQSSTDRQKIMAKRRQRTNIMLVLMVVAFVVSWTPNTIFWFLFDRSLLPDVLSQQVYFCSLVTHAIAMMSTLTNPCLYAVLNEQLRNGAIDCLPVCVQRYLRHLTTSEMPIGHVGARNGHLLRHRGSDFDDMSLMPANGNVMDTTCSTPMLPNQSLCMDPKGVGGTGCGRASVKVQKSTILNGSHSTSPMRSTIITTLLDDDEDEGDQILL